VCEKLPPKSVENKEISARWLFGSDRLEVFHRSRRGPSTTVGMTGRDAQPRFIAQKPRDGEEVGCATRHRRDEFRGGYRDEERLAIPSVEARMRVGVATIPIRLSLRAGSPLRSHDRRGEGTVMAKSRTCDYGLSRGTRQATKPSKQRGVPLGWHHWIVYVVDSRMPVDLRTVTH